MVIVKEKQTYPIKMAFRSGSGEGITPETGTYRIDDVKSGTQIKGDTVFTPSEPFHTILLSEAENNLIDTDNVFEIRAVTITIELWGLKGVREFRYLLQNLMFKT